MADRKNQKQKRQKVTEAFWKNDIKKAEELGKRKFLPFEEVLKRAGLSDKVRVTSGARTKPMGSAGTKSNHLKRDEYGDSRAFDLVSLVPNKSVYDLLYENPMTRDYLSLRNARYIDERTPAVLARTKGTGAHEHISLSDDIGLREGRAFIPAGVQSVGASFDAAMQTPQFDILQKVVTPDFINTLPSTLPTPSTPQALISEQQALMPSITLDEVEVIGNRPQAHPLDIITPRTLENIVEDRRETTPAVNTVAQVQNNLLDMRQKELEDNILYPSSSSYSFLDDEERQRRMQRDVEDLQFERQMNEALKPLLNKSAYGGKLFDGGGYISEEERARRKAAEEAFWQGDMENAKRLAVAPKPERMYEAAYEGPEISITPDIPYTELMKSAEKANLANRVAADLSTPTIGDQIEMGINQTIPFVGLVNSGLHQLRGGIEDLWGNTYEAERHRQLANRASDNSLIPTGTTLAAMTGNPWILGGVEGGFLGEALHDVDMNGLNNENAGSLAMASMAPFFHFQSETFPAMKTTLENKIAASPGMQVLKESPAAILDLVRPEGRAAFNIARDNMLNTQGVWDGSVDPSYFFHNKSMRYYTDHPYSGTRTADRDAKYLNAGKYKELVDDLRYFLSHDEGSLPGISVDTWGTKDRFTPKTIIEDIDLSNSGLLNSGTAQKSKLSDMTHVWRLDPQSGRYYRTYEEIPLNRRDAPKNTHSNMLRNLVDRDGNVDWDRFYSILNKDNVFIENTLVNKALKSENRVQELDKLLANDEITREEYQKLLARTAPENMSIEELMETQVNSSGNLKKHIEDVVKSAQAFPLPKGVSRKEFVTAALWHDVGKLIDYRNHGAVSADIMNRHLKEIASVYEFGEPQFNIKDIENAIRNHMSTETYYDRGLTKALQAVDVARGQSDAMEFGMQSPNIMGYDNGMHPTYTPMTPQEEIGTINKVFDKLGIDPIDSSMPQEAWEAEIADRLFKARTMVRGTSVPSLSDVYEYGPNKGKPVVKTVLELMSGKKDVDAYAWVKMSDAERQANGLPTLKEFNKKFAEYPITSQGHGRFNYEAGDRDLYRAGRRVGNSEYFKAQKGPFDALYLSNSQDILSNYSHGGGEGAHLVSLPVVPRKQGESLRSWVQRNMIDTYNSNHDAVIHNPNDNPMMGVQQLFEIPHLLQTGEDLGIKIRQSASFPKVTETRHPRIVAAEEKLWPTIDTKSIAGVKYLKDKYGIEMPVMKLDGRDVSYGTNFLTEVFQAEQSAYRLLQDIELGSFMKNDAREYTAYGFEKLNSKRFPDMIEELESTDLHEVSKSLRRARKVADDIIEDAATIYTGGTPQVFPEKVRNIVEDLDHLFNVQLTKESWDAIVKNPTSTESREIATMLKNSLGQLKSLMNNPETWRNYYTEDVKKSIVKDRLERLAESVKDRVERKINNYKKLKETLPETIVDDSAQRNYLMDRFNYLKLMKEAGTMPRYMQDDFNTNRAYITRSGQLDMTRPFEFLKEKTGSQGYVVGPADGSRQILWETPYEGSFLIKTPTSKDALPIGQFFNFRSFGGNLNEEESFPIHNLHEALKPLVNKGAYGMDLEGDPPTEATTDLKNLKGAELLEAFAKRGHDVGTISNDLVGIPNSRSAAIQYLTEDGSATLNTEVPEYFKSYVNSPGYKRIEQNQEDWWKKRHPYRQYLEYIDPFSRTFKGPELLKENVDAVWDKRPIVEYDSYPELAAYYLEPKMSLTAETSNTARGVREKDSAYTGVTAAHEAAAHEFLHSQLHGSPNGDSPLSSKTAQREALDFFNSRKNIEESLKKHYSEDEVQRQLNHDANPQEKQADLWGLKYLMYKEGIYDSRSPRDATKEDVEKIRKLYPNIRIMQQIENNDTIAKFLNTVAATDAQLDNKAACGGKLFDKGGPMEDEIAFQKWRATLPPNLQEDTIHYDLRGAYKAGLTPEWNEADKSYHLGSRDPRTGRILKKPSHPTFLVALVADAAEGYWPSKIDKDGTFYTEEDKWRGKLFGNVFDEGGPTEDNPVYSKKGKAWYRDSFIGEDGKTYYTNPIKPGMVYNGYTWNTDGTKTRVASDEEKAYYSTIDPRKGYPKNIGEAFQWWRNVKRKENSEDPSKMDYTVGETLGEKVADAAWRKRLQLPYDKELLPVWNGDTIRLPKALEMEIPTDTNMLKERIAANEKYMKSPSYRALKNRFKDAKNVVESSYNADVNALEALRKTYSTGKPVGINEMAFNNRHFVNDNILADNLLSPLNVLQGYNIRYDKDSNKMYYSDEYDFDNDSFFGISPEWVVPGKPFRFRGSIDLEKKK